MKYGVQCLARFVLAGLGGGALLLVIEASLLGLPSAQLGLLEASLLLALGAAIGCLVAVQEAIVARFALRGLRAAFARSILGIPVILLGSWRLFEGSYASTLISPTLVRTLGPPVCFALLVAAIYVASHRRWLALGRLGLIVPLLLALLVVQLAAHATILGGYPDLLATSTLLSSGAATLLFLFLLPAKLVAGTWPARVTVFAALLPVVALVWLLGSGLESPKQRWELVFRKGHTAHLVELVRRPFDSDRDGYSSVLGGGDCNDANARIHPSAVDRLDNGVDEDCDGSDDLVASAVLPDLAGFDQRIATWLEAPRVKEFLERSRKMNVVVVFVDTLRADMFEDTERNRKDFPRIFELLDQSRRFDRAFSPGSGTDLAMGTLLTGRIDPFVSIHTTLFEAMSQSGHSTYGVFPGEVLRWAGKTLISRGMDAIREVVTDLEQPDQGSHSSSMETTEIGLELLESHRAAQGETKRPAFLWLHYFDVHEHLQLPSSVSYAASWASSVDSSSSAHRVDRYRGTIKLVDEAVGRLMDELRARGLWDQTIIVFASDHGESMLEDPRLPDAHGLYVYNALTHVPVAIQIPGVSARRIMTPIALADLSPTLAALTGAQGFDDTEAHTLLHHLIDDDNASVEGLGWPILLHEQKQWGLIVWPYKLMVRFEDNLTELYDLQFDFLERRDLSFIDPEKVRAMEALRAQYPAFQVVRTLSILREREILAERP